MRKCIYHNVALRAPLKRTERDSDADTAKRDVLPSENRKNASGSFSAHCIAMHENEMTNGLGAYGAHETHFRTFSVRESLTHCYISEQTPLAAPPGASCKKHTAPLAAPLI